MWLFCQYHCPSSCIHCLYRSCSQHILTYHLWQLINWSVVVPNPSPFFLFQHQKHLNKPRFHFRHSPKQCCSYYMYMFTNFGYQRMPKNNPTAQWPQFLFCFIHCLDVHWYFWLENSERSHVYYSEINIGPSQTQLKGILQVFKIPHFVVKNFFEGHRNSPFIHLSQICFQCSQQSRFLFLMLLQDCNILNFTVSHLLEESTSACHFLLYSKISLSIPS